MHKIKELRKLHGDTLRSLAAKLNYDHSNLSKIERGIYTPSLELLRKIAALYNVDIAHLLDEPAPKQYNTQEKQLLSDLHLDLADIHEKYNLVLDDQQITKQEMDFMLEIIRKLRKSFHHES